MAKKEALLLSFLVASTSSYIVTGKSSSTCGDGGECHVGLQAAETILLQKKGELHQHSSVKQHSTPLMWSKVIHPDDGADSRNGADTDFIIIGDSWAEGARQVLAAKCDGKTVVNRGVGGSTAKEWAGGAAETAACISRGTCSATSAFSDTYGKGYTHAWLSVGGNDWMGTGCNILNKPELITNIKATIASVVAAAPFGLRILMTGYGATAEAVGDCANQGVVELQGAIKAAIEGSPHKASIVFYDVISQFGGSATKYSDSQWYGDSIHLNAVGYGRFFGLPVIQTFFGCPGAAADTCETCAGCIYDDKCYITYDGHTVDESLCNEYEGEWCSA